MAEPQSTPPTSAVEDLMSRDAPVALTRGTNGMPKAVLAHPSGATAELYLNGAHLTSWRTSGRDEVLFLSEHAKFTPGAGIRGGVPIIFPQFGPGILPQHGFARVQEWTLTESGTDERHAVFARLRLEDDPATRALWPYSFLAELTVSLVSALEVNLAVTNTGDQPFSFTAALHNYFRIADVREVRIEGLRGLRYRDKVRGGVVMVDKEESLAMRGETDRVYLNAPPTVHIRDRGGNRTVQVRKQGFADVVVWNPWTDRARQMQDFGDAEYLGMVCVETAQVGDPVRLDAGATWRGGQTLSVVTEGSSPAEKSDHE